jgi:hypothetical protein
LGTATAHRRIPISVIPTAHLVGGNAWIGVLAITEIVVFGHSDLDFPIFATILASPLPPPIGAA